MSTRGTTTEYTPNWRTRGACRDTDPEAFYPVGTGPVALAQTREAKEFCRGCPVVETCARWALDHRMDDGVWGGLDEAQRRQILRHATNKQLADPMYLGRAIQAMWRLDSSGPLVNAYLDRTEQDTGGHVRWKARSTTTFLVGNRSYTPKQLAFTLGFGRRPIGIVRADCGQSSCVAPEHLSDEEMRMSRDPYGLLKRDAERTDAA